MLLPDPYNLAKKEPPKCPKHGCHMRSTPRGWICTLCEKHAQTDQRTKKERQQDADWLDWHQTRESVRPF